MSIRFDILCHICSSNNDMQVLMELKKLGKMSVRAGWVDGNVTAAEAYAHLMEKKATGKDQPALGRPVSIALIARTLNYGREPGQTISGHKYGRIPARPFMQLAEKKMAENMPKILKAYLPELLSGKMSKTAFLEMLGSRMAGEIKDAMTNGQWAPLSPKTIKRRRHGGSQPLIDTGTLRASVSFEIEK